MVHTGAPKTKFIDSEKKVGDWNFQKGWKLMQHLKNKFKEPRWQPLEGLERITFNNRDHTLLLYYSAMRNFKALFQKDQRWMNIFVTWVGLSRIRGTKNLTQFYIIWNCTVLLQFILWKTSSEVKCRFENLWNSKKILQVTFNNPFRVLSSFTR